MTCISKITTGDRAAEKPRRSGQVIIFLATMLVILFFVVLWNFDLHTIIRIKQVSQNAGDASALMAARWQGITLNLVGDLNLMKAVALSTDNPTAVTTIDDAQARLCLTGPMIGFMAAQQAAKNNGIYVNTDPGLLELLNAHAYNIRNVYPYEVDDGVQLYPPPYDNAWIEYADMLDLIIAEGVAAYSPPNLYSDYGGDHILLMKGFYEAIAGKSWCWFYNNAPTLLTDYQEFSPCWWPPLPEIKQPQCINCEYFGLGLAKFTTTVANVISVTNLQSIGDLRGFPIANTNGLTNQVAWYLYGGAWGTWDAMGNTGAYPIPLTGTVRPKYNYSGADSLVSIEAEMVRLTPGPGGTSTTNTIVWTAAAKPFGYLDQDQRPNSHSLVMPAYRDVRLIPLDAASSGSGGGDPSIQWQVHIHVHLRDKYMLNGPSGLDPGCYYCNQLVTWESASFRDEGEAYVTSVDWVKQNCTPSGGPGGGGGGSGGRRRGH